MAAPGRTTEKPGGYAVKFKINDQRVSALTFVKTAGSAGAVVLLLLSVVLVVGYALAGWLVMLLLGALHHSVWEAVPALGFGPSVIVAVALGFISSLFGK